MIIIKILAILLGVSALVACFKESPLGTVLLVIVALMISLATKKRKKRKQEELARLSPDEFRELALREYEEKARLEQALHGIRMDRENQKRIARLKSYLKSKIGLEVNPTSDTIEIDGIHFSVQNLPDRYWPVLIGWFHCKTCRGSVRIIDALDDYGYLVQTYQEHVNTCLKNDLRP